LIQFRFFADAIELISIWQAQSRYINLMKSEMKKPKIPGFYEGVFDQLFGIYQWLFEYIKLRPYNPAKVTQL
jgi:hypothetical protein